MSEEELARRVDELERRVAALEGAPRPPAGSSSGKTISLREFLMSKAPKTKGDAALVMGYHLEKESKVSPFNLDDLSKAFAEAKEPLPGNPSDLLYQNVKRGFLMEAREKKDGSKAYVVTNSGERFVEGGLKDG